MIKPTIGQVVRFRCPSGIYMGIIKGRRRIQQGTHSLSCPLIYMPGVGDAPILARQITDSHPWCKQCTGCQWYWRGGEPLFPAQILCATCHPPTVDPEWIRNEVADAFACIRARMGPEEFEGLAACQEGLAKNPWPDVQKLLWKCWLAVTAGPAPVGHA